MKITRFEDVEAWKEARRLMGCVYEATKGPAFVEERDLARQLRRAAVSAMSNIAEGFDAGSDPEFRRFLRMGRRSLSELQSHLYVALDLRLVGQEGFADLYEQAVSVKRLMGGFLRYLKASRPAPGCSGRAPSRPRPLRPSPDLGPRT